MSLVLGLRFRARRLLIVAIGLIAMCAGLARATPSFAFYYGPDIPWESLGAFDVAVVEPGHVGPGGWTHRLNPDTTVAAYVSVGEVHPGRSYFSALRPEWKLGTNAAWGSVVVDQSAPGWPAFYVERVVKPLWEQGYRAFFLDTLDSFHLVAKSDATRDQQARGLAAVVRAIKTAYPEARLIFNRGFEILPEVHTLAYAVAAESLFQGHDAGQQKYRVVPQADRDWLLGQLLKCRDTYRLPVVAIDYVPPNERALARETAQKIRALGIVPWVTNPALDMLGVGQVEVLPRQVLAIHDQPGHAAQVATHPLHRVGTLPLNHLGLDARLVALPGDSGRHHAQADGGERQREQQAVAEHARAQVAQVEGDAEAAAHRVHAAPDQHAEAQQAQVEQRIQGLVQLAVRTACGQRAPEGQHAQQRGPEGIVAAAAARGSAAQVDPQAQQRDGSGLERRFAREVKPEQREDGVDAVTGRAQVRAQRVDHRRVCQRVGISQESSACSGFRWIAQGSAQSVARRLP